MRHQLQRLTLLISLLALTACATSGSPVDYDTRAMQLAQSLLIVDTHIDVPYRLQENPADVSKSTEDGDFDYPRAVAGGLNAPFMSIYIPAKKEPDGTATAFAHELIDELEEMAAATPGKFAIAHSTADVEENFRNGVISLPMGMENGAPIAGDLVNLQQFHARGIRYITLTHSKVNHISDSSYDENRVWHGLSPFGEKLIPAMNKLGVMVDISHVSDEAFYDALAISQVPLVATHSSARHFTPGFERNMDDDMIRALAAKGGIIMINFGSTFINQESRYSYDIMKAARTEYLEANDLVDDEHASEQFKEEFYIHSPFRFATLDEVLDHFDHIRDLVGVDYIGIGSDYDGVGDSLPVGLKDVSTYPNLIKGLLQRGYSESDIEKILGGNLMRVWKAAEDYASKF